MEEVEKMLGRKLKITEKILFETMKDKLDKYVFEKDKNGNLIANLKK